MRFLCVQIPFKPGLHISKVSTLVKWALFRYYNNVVVTVEVV